MFSTWAFQTACWVEILRGDLQLAVRHGKQAMETGASIASPWSTMPPWLLAAAWLELGEVERARELLYRSGMGPELSPFPMYAPGSFETLTRLELQSGNLDQAEKWSREAERAGEELGVGVQLAEGRRAGARVLLAAGRWGEAAELALSSVVAAEEVESPVEASRSRLIAGRALAEGEGATPLSGGADHRRRRAVLPPAALCGFATKPRPSCGGWEKGWRRSSPPPPTEMVSSA